MSGTFILIAVMAITVLLGKYAIAEGQRKESYKKFMKNMEEFDKKSYVESSKRDK
jgi:Trm5-related predicted tRNA methylase